MSLDRFEELPPEVAWEYFLQIRKLLLERTGMYFDDAKFKVVRNVVSERLTATSSPDFASYFQLITRQHTTSRLKEQSQREFNKLVENLVVNETSFFRNRDHFSAISNEILPGLLRRNAASRTMRFWSAGCSTGQEPYSLAMLVIEFLEKRGERLANGPDDLTGWRVEIVATDISEKVLATAQTGRFRREDMRGLDKARQERFFHPLNSPHVATAPLDPSHIVGPGQLPPVRGTARIAFEIAPQVRNLVKFGYFNLAQASYPLDKVNAFDMVLCENVMIYFSPEVTRQVIENLYRSIVPGGYFFIGFSETLWQVSERFKLLNTDDTFYYQKPFPNESLSKPAPAAEIKIEKPARVKQTPTPPPPPVSLAQPVKEPDLTPRPRPLKVEPLLLSTGTEAKSPPPKEPKESAPQSKTAAKPDWQALLADGLGYLEAHEFEKAAQALDQALLAGPREVDVLCALAHLKVSLGDYYTAADFCRQAIAINPLCEQAHLLLAMIYHRENQIEAAIEEYKQTIYINIDSIIAHIRLGDIRNMLGQTSSALVEYRSALEALKKRRKDEFIEGFSVDTLKQTCLNNIRRLQGAGRFR